MPDASTRDVVVVGAGIIGASIAHQLVRRSSLSVLVLDKGAGPAEGSTGASSSISRCRYSHPQMVRLALHGQRAYRSWSEFTGLPAPQALYRQLGAAWLFDRPRSETEADADRLREQGVAVSVVDPHGLRARYPAVSPCVAPLDFDRDHQCRPGEAFLVEDEGGYVDPVAALSDLHAAIRRFGGEIRFRAEVTGVTRSDGSVRGVEIGGVETVSAGLVVNAAGPWCNRINALAGVEHRWTLLPIRIQTVYRSWPADLGPLPMAADTSAGIYFRPELGTGQVLIGSVREEDERDEVDDPDEFRRVPDASFRDVKLAAFHHRIPGLEARGGSSGLAGLYTVNREDVHPLVGPSGVERFWLANGFSGHGFKLAPMIGSMVAGAVTGETMEFDADVPMSLFSVGRRPIAVEAKSVLA